MLELNLVFRMEDIKEYEAANNLIEGEFENSIYNMASRFTALGDI